MHPQTITTPHEKIWLDENGILRAMVLPNAFKELPDAKEVMRVCEELADGQKRPLLVDIRQSAGLSMDARKYFAGEETSKLVLALGMLIHTPLSRLLGNFFMKFNQPDFPVRLFTDEQRAVEWLKQYR